MEFEQQLIHISCSNIVFLAMY